MILSLFSSPKSVTISTFSANATVAMVCLYMKRFTKPFAVKFLICKNCTEVRLEEESIPMTRLTRPLQSVSVDTKTGPSNWFCFGLQCRSVSVKKCHVTSVYNQLLVVAIWRIVFVERHYKMWEEREIICCDIWFSIKWNSYKVTFWPSIELY